MFYEINKGVICESKERGEKEMTVNNTKEVVEYLEKRQQDLKLDGNREFSEFAKAVADWGCDLLEDIKSDIKAKSFDVQISAYKSSRTGEKSN